jgi:cyclohexadienyl dehydratase
MRGTWRKSVVLALCLIASGTAARSEPGTAPGAGSEPGTLRVGTSGDYPPFSDGSRSSGYEGFDVSVARVYAEERGLALEWVPFRWPRLLEDLAAGRFDVAMSGITVRPERSAVGRFSVPVVESGAVVIVREPDRWDRAEALDTRVARVGVNAGGHLERVARRKFEKATLLAIPENDAVPAALISGSVDAVVTDQHEAELWIREIEGGAIYGPFTRDRKAYLVRADRSELAADLDAWLLAREADGALAKLRRKHLTAPVPVAPATPLEALLAAMDERLMLMPIVGASKREEGLPLEAPERETRVLDAGVSAVAAAARRMASPPPPEAAVRAFFRAQIEAAKQVQWAALHDDGFATPEPLPDLESELRPALLRIGEKTAALLVALPAGLDGERVRGRAAAALRAPYLDRAAVRALADAVVDFSAARRQTARTGPALERLPEGEIIARGKPSSTEGEHIFHPRRCGIRTPLAQDPAVHADSRAVGATDPGICLAARLGETGGPATPSLSPLGRGAGDGSGSCAGPSSSLPSLSPRSSRARLPRAPRSG